jgi:Tol biopolymer transport system component
MSTASTETTRRTNRSRLRLGAVLAAFGLLCTLGLPSVSATTPGHNGRIAFKGYLDADRSTGAIFTVRPDGTHRRQITFPAADTVDDQPDWSPDGTLVAFRRCAPETVCAVYTVRRDGTHLHRLTAPCHATAPDIETKCADESEVAFLPDGRHVVLTRATGRVYEFPNGEGFIEHSDIVIRRLTGGPDRVVLRSRPFAGDNVQMVASPDGTRIAFLRDNSPATEPAGGIALFVMRVDGSHRRRITPWSLRAGDHPDWSPNGRWILFRSPDNGDFLDSQLYVIHPDGHDLRQITHLSAETELLSSSFSPDGTAITYAQRGRDGLPDIFTQQLRSGEARQVTSTALWESAPDWGPQPR